MKRHGLAGLFLALAACMLVAPAAAQAPGTGTITGVVTGEAGGPLQGVEVRVVGTRITYVTRQDGRFLLVNVPAGSHTIVAQTLGYANAEASDIVLAAGQTVRQDIGMSQTALSMEEIVVTGVSEATSRLRAPFTVGRVSRENIATVPTTNSAVAAIQGKIAGASIVRGSGQPGTGVSVMLRTPTSIAGGNSPMFVVDGVILNSEIGGTTVDLESLDIESIEVIRGAAAASMYGSRAASGVIQITTSRGRSLALDQTKITARTEIGRSQAPTGLSLTTSHQFRQNEQGQWLNSDGEVVARSLRAVVPHNMMDQPFRTQVYDNMDTFFRPAAFNQNSVNLSHRNETSNFLASATRYREAGTLEENDGFTRDNYRVNLDHRLNTAFSLGVSAAHSRYDRDLLYAGVGNVYWDLLMTPRDVNLGKRGANGELLMQPDSSYSDINPLWYESNRDYYEKRARTLANVNGRLNPVSWLNIIGEIGYDRSDANTTAYTPKGTPTSLTTETESGGFLRKDNEIGDVLNASLQANMTHNFGALSTRTVARALLEREHTQFVRADGSNFWVVGVPDLSVASVRDVSSSLQEVRSSGYFLEETIEYDTRYMLTGLVRRDGSSLFGDNERWHNYYRVGAHWRISEEPWFNVNPFTELRLRYATGTAGGRPGFSAQYETWSVSGSTGAVSKETLGNRNLKPSHTTEHEMGVDMAFADRYELRLTHARQNTTDQIIQLVLPAMFGYPQQWYNTGAMTGKSYEAEFEARLINRPGFIWSSSVVADRSESTMTEWNRSCYFATLRKVCAGASLADMWGERHLTGTSEITARHPGAASQFQVNDDGYLVWVGEGNSWRDGLSKNLWGTAGEVDGETYQWGLPILDRDEEGFTTVQQIGSSQPDMQVGWLNNLLWRGFSIHSHVHAQVGGHTYNATKQRLYQHERSGDLDQTGKPDETKKTIDYYQSIYNRAVNTAHFVEPGSYVKLRAVSVQYRLNQTQLNRLGVGRLASELSLGLNGRNLFTLTKYSGFDPEVGSVLQRYDDFDYPNARQFTFTAELNF